MSDLSSAELEREAEAAREKVAGTAESIRKKLTAGQLIDEFTDMFTGGDLTGAVRNLKAQVRDNPLPVVLLGAGVAWLAFGRGVSDGHFHAPHSAPRASGGRGSNTSGNDGESAISSAAEGARSAISSVSDTVGNVADSLSTTADRLRHSMLTGTSHGSRNVQDRVSDAAEQEPLLIAALGLTLGAVAGAMFPVSELEKEQIGAHAKRLREAGSDVIDRGMDSVGKVASKTYDALKEEADRQGLVSRDGRSVGERVGEVVRSAAQSAEDAAREELGTGQDAGRQGT